MTVPNFEQIESTIQVRCSATWPSQVDGGSSFQRNIGRSRNDSVLTEYSILAFPLSLLRDAAAFERLCRRELPSLLIQVDQSWDLHLDFDLGGVAQRVLFPPTIYGATVGPGPPDASVDDVQKQIAFFSDQYWCSLQIYYANNLAVVEATGMTSHALDAVYRWFWAAKDGPNRASPDVDNLLVTEYLQLAREAVSEGDDEMAAQYSKVAFDLSPDQNANELLSEFEPLVGRWDKLAVVRENAVKKVAAVAREGFAEHGRLKQTELYRRGLISPLTEGSRHYLSTHDVNVDRAKIARRSAFNPYRYGLELADTVDNGIGPVALLMWGIITEYPLEALRLRVPPYAVQQLQGDSPFAPDLRVEKLAELAQRTIQMGMGPISSPSEVMPRLYDIHLHLDGSVPGFLTCALSQLEIEKGEEA